MDPSEGKQKDPCLITRTHFLKPYVTFIDGPVAELPPRRRRFSVSSSDLETLSSKVSSSGFRVGNRHFKSWARKMEALHKPVWVKAGIFEAIKASTYKIPKNPSLILALVEKWCPETKSFVFPWGEATITLEDVILLLGFSVLGSPVFDPLESSEMRDSVEKLEKARVENMGQKSWISSFRYIYDDDKIEHEAFLTMWLSDFVFPETSCRSSISRNVIPIAVRLASGEKIALAPAVLASLYRDLDRIHGFARDESTNQKVTLKSLFKLVQVWIWERFRNIRPEARELQKGEPRIAQWSSRKKRYEKNQRLSFDDFEWRPYAKPLENWSYPRFYLEEAKWMTVDDDLDDEFVSFARCLRVSQLVGIGFVEDYYPNRVAMQFGLAQDLPGLVTHHHRNFTEKEAWDDYNKSLDGLKLYVPSRLATTSVTERYRDWWLKSVSEFLSSQESTAINDDSSPQELPLSQVFQKLGERFPAKLKRCRTRRRAKKLRFERKRGEIGDLVGSSSREVPLSELLVKRKSERLRNKRAREDEDDDDDITIAQRIKSREKTRGNASESLVKRSRLEEENNNDSGICQKLGSGDLVGSSSREDPLSELLVKRKSERLRNKRAREQRKKNGEDASKSLGERRRLEEENNNDSGTCQKLGSGDLVGSSSREVPLSELLVKRKSERLRNKRAREERKKTGEDASKSLGKRRRLEEENNNDSGTCQELGSGDDETVVAPQEIEQSSEEDSGSVSKIPLRRHSVSSRKRLSSRISFSGFWFAERYYISWLVKMEALYEPIWRKAGIFEAIKASTYNISKNQSLVLSVAEKWCPETKSFVFPWGEATISLEDVMVLLGFSVLGSSVFAPLKSSELRDSVAKLLKARLELNRTANGHGGVSQSSWIQSFLGRDDEMEHEAFLVLWLSFYVFPSTSRRSISRNVIPVAVRLARGERIALAPPVLASIYRDLGVIHGLAKEKCVDKVNLKSLFKLVQVWTWERFKNTRPKARDIPIGEPRIAQWDTLQQISDKNVRLRFKDFDWRPYTKPLKNWNPLRFYVEDASFAQCMRVSKLAGDGFVEDYYPNQVAMQFGLAQDLPGLVPRHSNFTKENNNDSRICQKLASGDDVTVVAPKETEQRSEEETRIKSENITFLMPSNENNSLDPPPGFNGGIVKITVSTREARQRSDDDDDDGVHVDGSNAEKKTMLDDGIGTKEEECLLREKQRDKLCSEAKKEEDIDERLKQRKLAIKEMELKLETRIVKMEKTLAMIREWKTKRNHTNIGVST